jgi:23S rRNA pseudouridine1911/1915/1917 synthase
VRFEPYHIIHEDRHIIVVNKPAGLLTVPIPKSKAVNLFDLLKQQVKRSGSVFVVHRIDRFTSGIVLFARTRPAYEFLKNQFIDRSAIRTYHAVVHGVPRASGTLTHHLKLIKNSFKNVIVDANDPGGSLAKLDYRVIESYGQKASSLEITLDTGLKNQIRVQFDCIGHPVIGDFQYGEHDDKMGMERQALHALSLEFTHPGNQKKVRFEAPLAKDIQKLIKRLKTQF